VGSDLTTNEEQLAEAEATAQSQQEEVNDLLEEQSKVKDAYDIVVAELADEQAKLTGFDDELHELESAKSKKLRQITEESLETQKLNHAVEKSTKESSSAQQLVHALEKEHDWIEDNRSQFGKSNTPYDFQGKNLSESRTSLKTVTERFQGMKKKINPKVMPMIDSVEKKEAALKNMMKTVVRDKKKIEETIATLDEYKNEALLKTWRKVTVDFGNIFAELLPGNNTAKLDPPEGDEARIQQGLEVKVCLGKVWKQSLTELSGGQRYTSPPPMHFTFALKTLFAFYTKY
jgi:structural maintenance of chromosome 2